MSATKLNGIAFNPWPQARPYRAEPGPFGLNVPRKLALSRSRPLCCQVWFQSCKAVLRRVGKNCFANGIELMITESTSISEESGTVSSYRIRLRTYFGGHQVSARQFPRPSRQQIPPPVNRFLHEQLNPTSHSQSIRGAFHRQAWFVHHMQVDHRRADILVAQQILNRANVGSVFQ